MTGLTMPIPNGTNQREFIRSGDAIFCKTLTSYSPYFIGNSYPRQCV